MTDAAFYETENRLLQDMADRFRRFSEAHKKGVTEDEARELMARRKMSPCVSGGKNNREVHSRW